MKQEKWINKFKCRRVKKVKAKKLLLVGFIRVH